MAQAEQKRSYLLLQWVAGIAVVIAVIYSIRSVTRTVVRVVVAPVTYQELTATVSTNGKVEPVEPFDAHAPGNGVIQNIYVDEGEHVTVGQPLLKMDDTDARSRLAAAETSLAQAKLQLADLERGGDSEAHLTYASNIASAQLEQRAAAENLRAVKALEKKGSASASEVAAAQQRLDSANLALSSANAHTTGHYSSDDRAAAEARIHDSEVALQAAQAALQDADVHSPINGTVYYIPVSEFDFVHAGDDLIYVADLKKLMVRAYFDEPEIGKLANGQPVTITWDAKPLQVWHGHIEHIPNTIKNYGTRNVGECIITVDDAKGDLPPNSNVTVKVTEAKRDHVLSVPREALHTDGSRNFVYTIADGKLQQTPIQPGLLNNTNVQILSGLGPNDTVVLGPADPGQELYSGLPVKPVKKAAQ
jgi:HlyD family secretion protein